MEKTPERSVERRQITASTPQGGGMCTWSSPCQGVIPPFCYSWNNAGSCRKLYMWTHGLAQGRRGEMWDGCGCCPASPREGGLCAARQTERSLLTFFIFFFPQYFQSCWALQMCRFKMPFGLCFWAVCIAQRQGFAEGVLLPKRRVSFVRRWEAMSVVLLSSDFFRMTY